ncbi:MAG: LuxR C-terminal-related transcriptional regulator [Chloroflexota bacterium]
MREPGDLRWLSEEVEALLLAGRGRAEARDRTRLLLSMADAVGRPSATSASLVAKGLVHAAEGHLDRALTDLETAACHAEEAPLPFERARVQLCAGSRPATARAQRGLGRTLGEQAAGPSRPSGAAHWAETCRTELGRIGGRPPGGDALTETERRVVALVARGLSNKEVASALFVTPRRSRRASRMLCQDRRAVTGGARRARRSRGDTDQE